MGKFDNWLEHKDPIEEPKKRPMMPSKKNEEGGFDPRTKKETEIFKKVDLITLPENISGATCANCEYIKDYDKKKDVGFCSNRNINLYVGGTRMCCTEWDHFKVKRKGFKRED